VDRVTRRATFVAHHTIRSDNSESIATMRQRKAVIIGGSLGGLLAANLLRCTGWDVEVYERTGDDLASRGAGIGTHDALLEIMLRAGIVVDASIGVQPLSRTCLALDGSVLHEITRPRILSSWGRLYRALKDALPRERYYFERSLVALEQEAGAVTAVFADGTRSTADLLVGADGLRSTVRTLLMPEVEPRYAGYVAWRGTINEADMPAGLHRAIFERNVMCLPQGEILSAYPVPGPDNDVRPGRRAYNLVWYHPVDEASLTAMCTDASGRCHGTSIPPPLIRAEVIEAIRSIARRVLAPQCARLVEVIPQLFFQAIYDLESPHLVQGRAALLGDAAFVARPHVGMGVTKAALDAECLADALAGSESIDTALATYDVAQRLFGSRVVARGRRIGAHLEAQSKPRGARTPEELHQDPQWVMRESARRLAEIPDLMEAVQAARQATQSAAPPSHRSTSKAFDAKDAR
jgi:2-polyprenyl-6-methoxyphenol hydroxylase-like FAD-dependent oxidoreductase